MNKGCETEDVSMDLIINLSSDECNYESQSYIINFSREKLEILLTHLSRENMKEKEKTWIEI